GDHGHAALAAVRIRPAHESLSGPGARRGGAASFAGERVTVRAAPRLDRGASPRYARGCDGYPARSWRPAAGHLPPSRPARRLRPAPHGLPRPDLDRLGHVLPLLQGRWDIARPSRVQANALLQRPWIEPEPRGDGGTPGDDRPPERPGCGGVLSGVEEGDRGGGGDPRILLRWHGPRRRARDFDLPRHRSRRRGHGQGRGRTELPGRRQRSPRMVGRRTPAVHAVV